MSGRVTLVYGDSLLDYRHSESHPLQPARVKNTVDLIRSRGLLQAVHVAAPRPATDEEIELVHAPEYIDLVKHLGDGTARAPDGAARRAGFGSGDNPIFPRMHEASALIAGASVVAAEAVHSGDALHAFNPAGGLHHAMRSRASGFCVYDDPAIAVAWLRKHGHRVAYVDVDVHHGDGVQALFYDDPEVLTISLHEGGDYLFPGTGFPDETGSRGAERSAANLPFEPYTWNEPWLAAFEAVVPPLLRRFAPTVLVTQDGCDTHVLDPLAHLECTTRIWPVVGARFHELAHELCDGRWVATGGGGYAQSVVPRAWTLLFAEMVERRELASGLHDEEDVQPDPRLQRRVWDALDARLEELGQGLDLPLTRVSIA